MPATRAGIKRPLDGPDGANPSVKNWMAFAVKGEALSKRWTLEALAGGFLRRGVRLGAGIRATDLTEDFARLSVPTLAMSALRGAKSPPAGSAVGHTQSHISADTPAESDRALSDFLSGLL